MRTCYIGWSVQEIKECEAGQVLEELEVFDYLGVLKLRGEDGDGQQSAWAESYMTKMGMKMRMMMTRAECSSITRSTVNQISKPTIMLAHRMLRMRIISSQVFNSIPIIIIPLTSKQANHYLSHNCTMIADSGICKRCKCIHDKGRSVLDGLSKLPNNAPHLILSIVQCVPSLFELLQ